MTQTVVSSHSQEVVIGFDRPFCVIGERINPTGRKLLAAEMVAGDYSGVEADALAQVAAGAHMLDVNAGIPLADEPAILAETGAPAVGTMVVGTVKGDIHDIGKNLVAMMMEGAGFEVINIGINNAVENYLEAIEEHQPDILGMSALLTTTMPYMKVVIDTLKEKGMRDDYIVLVGGAPLNEAFAEAIGADAYCRDAAVTVETAQEWMARKHNIRGGTAA